jgi:transcriptional regulator with XRE-family HTH domain
MNFFEEATLRLKQQLGVSQDKDVAQMLGLSPQAWAGRKKRGLWPEKEFLALMAKRPDLGLDFDYVTLGTHSQVFEATAKQAAQSPLTGPEERMAGVFGKLSHASRKEVLAVALRLRELEMAVEKRAVP